MGHCHHSESLASNYSVHWVWMRHLHGTAVSSSCVVKREACGQGPPAGALISDCTASVRLDYCGWLALWGWLTIFFCPGLPLMLTDVTVTTALSWCKIDWETNLGKIKSKEYSVITTIWLLRNMVQKLPLWCFWAQAPCGQQLRVSWFSGLQSQKHLCCNQAIKINSYFLGLYDVPYNGKRDDLWFCDFLFKWQNCMLQKLSLTDEIQTSGFWLVNFLLPRNHLLF